MAHANIRNNELVNDDGLPVKKLSFAADRTSSKFSDQIQLLSSQRNNIPSGWTRIFDDAIRSLRAVDCPNRNGIEISEIAFSCGSMYITNYYAPTDKVVSGILRCLTKRSACTCQVCGRGYGAVYQQNSLHTLCARCHVKTDLAAELRRWLPENGASRAYRNRPIIEFDSLPKNIQLLISKGQIKRLQLISGDQAIMYVTPDAVTTHLKALVLMKRFLDLTHKT
jgi:hypothetical protein